MSQKIVYFFSFFVLLFYVFESCNSVVVRNPPILNIGSFNLENFGPSKASNDRYLRLIAKIICKYDVMAVVEVQDSTHNSLDDLARFINVEIECRHIYGYRVGPRSGTTSYKEQLVFFYRQTTLEPIETLAYGGKRFERPPFMGIFKSKAVPDFTFLAMAVHLRPDNVMNELKYLKRAYNSVLKRFGSEFKLSSAFIIGDFK